MNILNEIYTICENKCGFIPESTKTRLRLRWMVVARNIYFKMARQYTKYPLMRIGLTCNRDHATVIHGLKTIENDILQYPEISQLVIDIQFTVSYLLKFKSISKIDSALLILENNLNNLTRLVSEFDNLRNEIIEKINIEKYEEYKKTA